MLIIKLIGVATVVGMVVRWKRIRLPLVVLLVLLLGLLLQRFYCSHEELEERGKPQDIRPIQPYDEVCPYPDIGCKEPGTPVDGGVGP